MKNILLILSIILTSCATLRKEPVLVVRHLENGFEGIYLSDMKYVYIITDDSTIIGHFYNAKEGITRNITIWEYLERENEVTPNVAPLSKLILNYEP